MSRTALIRYNFRVLMFNNWWLLVIPIAASQLTVFWTATTQQQFHPDLPATVVELVSPLLAAFLCAHLLSAEYRSGIGAVLASKPIDISKVVLWRLLIALGLVWLLGALSLAAFYFGMEPYPFTPPLLAMMSSSLFLALLALTFATLFRHPLTGFGVATLYWAMDLPTGPPLNPYLSLKSLSSSYLLPGTPPGQPLTDYWWVAKIILVVTAITLYLLHKNLLFTLGSPLTLRKRRRTVAWIVGMLSFYIVTGATVKVIFGYTHRGTLFPDDASWFRKQFAPFGPVPVSALFGANFRGYVGSIPNAWRIQQEGESDTLGDNQQHRKDLEAIITNTPNSLWAPSAADMLARFRGRGKDAPDSRVETYRLLIQRYPDSPYLAHALQQIGHIYSEATNYDSGFDVKARTAYEELLKRFPSGDYAHEALRYLAESDKRNGDSLSAHRHGQQWVDAAPVYIKFYAWAFLADLWHDENNEVETKRAVVSTRQAIKEFRKAKDDGTIPLPSNRISIMEQQAGGIDTHLRTFE